MGIDDEMQRAADNAAADLGGTAEPTDDRHVPEPGNPEDNIEVNSSISEATNTTTAEEAEQESGPDDRGLTASNAPTD